jgi:hypothetical protein
VSEEFRFLLELGFRLVELDVTFARYETNRRFLNAFHGRGSFELGVEIGRWLDIRGERREELLTLRDVMELERPADGGYGEMSAMTPELVRKFVQQLAAWTREFAIPLLTNGDYLFDRISTINAARSQAELEQLEASRLRAQADQAWRQRDFATVVSVYDEIDNELPTVQLRPFERGRLDYARNHIGA